MSAWKLIHRDVLENGWTLLEYDHETFAAYVCRAKGDGHLMRATEQITYVPSERVVKVLHFVGSTEHDREAGWRTAARNARAGKMVTHRGCWTRRRHKNGRAWKYTVSIGDPIDVAEEFEQIARHLEDDAFTSIMSSLGVSTT